MIRNLSPIREKIVLRLKELNLTRTALCDDLHIGKPNFSAFLAGTRPLPFEKLEEIIIYLGLTVKKKDYKEGGEQ